MIDSLKNIKPIKILGKGSEGTVILTNNKKYTVKIYEKEIDQLQTYVKIIDYLHKDMKIPRTIYKSYFLTYYKNSLNRYVKNNLPNHFSYIDNDNLKTLSKKYNMQNKLFEIMKTYNITLKQFLKNINNDILDSLYKQGILTLLWLYINKGIVHNDIIIDNFFILKTSSKKFKINIYNDSYEVKLYGYYLIIADFGYAVTMEINQYINNINYKLNPLHDIKRFINIFNNKINLDINDEILEQSYHIMINSYLQNNLDLNKNIKNYKKILYKYIKNNIIKLF